MSNEFYNREQVQNDLPNKFSKLIELYTGEDSFFEINPTGILYSLAVNEISKYNFVERNRIPDWFCGFIDLEDGDSYLSEQQRRLNDALNLQTSVTTAIQIEETPLVRYNNDLCLSFGVPGSYSYSQCMDDPNFKRFFGLADEVSAKDFRIDIASNTRSIDNIVSSSLSQLEDAVFAELEAAIETELLNEAETETFPGSEE